MEQKAMEDDLIRLFRKMIKIDFSAYLHGISREEFYMMGTIEEYFEREKDAEGMNVSAIAKALDVSSPAVSRMLRGMEQKGYIMKQVSSQNRRNTLVRLTGKGVQAYERARKELDRLLLKVMDYMGQRDMEEFIRLWNKLAGGFIEEYRLCKAAIHTKGDGHNERQI